MYRDQPRFHREDASYRRIPRDARGDKLSVWHFGYPTRDAERDVNCVFPLERMRELEAAGVIGELVDPAFSFMGRIYSSRKVRDELAPQIVDELKRACRDKKESVGVHFGVALWIAVRDRADYLGDRLLERGVQTHDRRDRAPRLSKQREALPQPLASDVKQNDRGKINPAR